MYWDKICVSREALPRGHIPQLHTNHVVDAEGLCALLSLSFGQDLVFVWHKNFDVLSLKGDFLSSTRVVGPKECGPQRAGSKVAEPPALVALMPQRVKGSTSTTGNSGPAKQP